MSLSAKLAFEFDKRVQLKGVALFQRRAVSEFQSSPREFHARVHGGQHYTVHLTVQSDTLTLSCNCAFYDQWGPCKHLWAALLEAEQRGALSALDLTRKVNLIWGEPDDYDEESGAELGLDHADEPRQSPYSPRVRYPIPAPPQIPAWEEHLGAIGRSLQVRNPASSTEWPRDFEIWYVVDIFASRSSGAIVLDLLSRSRKKNGEWTVYKEFRAVSEKIAALPDAFDREAISMMSGGPADYYQYQYGFSSSARRTIPAVLNLKLLPQIAATGRMAYRTDRDSKLKPLQWDEGEPWKLWLDVRQDERDQWKISGSLRRGAERMDLSEPQLLLQSGIVLAGGLLARFDHGGAFPWVVQLRNIKSIPFPDRDRDAVIGKLLECAVIPPLDTDEALRFEQRTGKPRVGLRVKKSRGLSAEHFESRLLLDYGKGWKEDTGSGRGVWIPDERVYLAPDSEAESEARGKLQELGMKPQAEGAWRMPDRSLPRIVRELLQAGWHVEAEGKAFRRAGETRVDVRSGIDWFELHAEVDYGGVTATLPQLLAAVRRGDTMVQLGDGTFGLLPEEWLARFAPVAGLGTEQDEHLRFQRNQAGILDALLAAQPEVRVDEVFDRARQRLRRFEGVQAPPQPEGFRGKLRDYQREGLGWMEFLREFGFGGCLADDMGVGKTAQVLALLENRRTEGRGPSLVVAPRSLIFNWREEAARFTPCLRVLDHTGTARDFAQIGQHDLVLTTYGTMLRDIATLADIEFDYLVLDEAQAIKNSSTASARAVRLLKGAHRLALSGTPIENHLGELWSLFEFLNPGMLGEAKVLKMAGGLGRNPGEEARVMLSHALRPFILRRTKRQVARELPEKTEQTIFCELDAPQRKQYDELRRHYRDTLLERIRTQGLAKSKMHVLEALLRLRQAACHPGLLDQKRASEPSAKLDTLMAQLDEIRQEGHKALVFSQFTSLLSIVRRKLDEAGIRYEYLDGKTRDRQARVESFQADDAIGLFLISLKAGGLGLNLTAAEYVFLLDPWWNPAVEAQAVDRAHRIGQTRPVFAYRLIARDTVEEKVLALQNTKRDLADAILNEDNSLIRDLKREDLELLLS